MIPQRKLAYDDYGAPPYTYPHGPTADFSSSPAKRSPVDIKGVESAVNADQAQAKRRGGRKTSGGTRYIAGRKNGKK